MALVSGHPPNICAEIGRTSVSPNKKPDVQKMESALAELTSGAGA